jgi:hypothetical protein
VLHYKVFFSGISRGGASPNEPEMRRIEALRIALGSIKYCTALESQLPELSVFENPRRGAVADIDFTLAT